MSASAYLIVIVSLAAVFVAGVFADARLERTSPRIARLGFRVGLLAGYAAGMVAVGWAMYDFVIPQMEKVAAVIGDKAMFFVVMGVGGGIGLWGYWGLYKHHQRQRSGKFLEPREP